VDPAGAVTEDRVVEFDGATDDEHSATWLGTGDDVLFHLIEGSEHRLATGSVAVGHGPARDLGLSATDWIATTLAPDGRTMIASIPRSDGGRPDIRAIDMEAATSTPTELAGDDLTWQRLAVR
jgi:hypothetical protein